MRFTGRQITGSSQLLVKISFFMNSPLGLQATDFYRISLRTGFVLKANILLISITQRVINVACGTSPGIFGSGVVRATTPLAHAAGSANNSLNPSLAIAIY